MIARVTAERVPFQREWGEGTDAAGTHLFSWLPLGSEATSEVLSPGTYTLVAETAGGRTLRHDVLLVDGQTLELTLEFE
jgi:hypothetical protein